MIQIMIIFVYANIIPRYSVLHFSFSVLQSGDINITGLNILDTELNELMKYEYWFDNMVR